MEKQMGHNMTSLSQRRRIIKRNNTRTNTDTNKSNDRQRQPEQEQSLARRQQQQQEQQEQPRFPERTRLPADTSPVSGAPRRNAKRDPPRPAPSAEGTPVPRCCPPWPRRSGPCLPTRRGRRRRRTYRQKIAQAKKHAPRKGRLQRGRMTTTTTITTSTRSLGLTQPNSC